MHKKKNQLKIFLESHLTDEVVAAVIVFNAIVLFMMTSPYLYEKYGFLLELFDKCSMVFFICELIIRIYAGKFHFFRNGWNLFDMFIILFSVLPQMGYFSALRAIRILRVVRLIKFFPRMHFLIIAVRDAIPGIVSISCFLSLFFFIFSLVAFNLFKDAGSNHFMTITLTFETMFQLMLDTNWFSIVKPLEGLVPYSKMFFACYIVVMKFTLLNLFFGLIINSMQSASHRENKRNMDILKTNINAATELETKNEINLERKVDALIEEIKSLRISLGKLN